MSPKTSILLLENIHPVAKEVLIEAGFSVDLLAHSPTPKELSALLKNYNCLGIRSKTEITKEILTHAQHLSAIGCFCIGTNQVDLNFANKSGIPVFNAPHSNTRSVAELIVAEMVLLSRQLCDRSEKAHRGVWLKSADGSREIRGKTVGIIGYGHIGSQVSILSEALGMKVLFFDVIKKLPLGNARSCSTLAELLKNSDFVTLHVPETAQTKDMIGAEQISLMRTGSYLLNASRGNVVVLESLAEALKSKKIAGCAIDVFPAEPASNKEPFKSLLQGLENVILTPHIGGSTEEAQKAIGAEVAESFLRFFKAGTTLGAVNFPQLAPGSMDSKKGAQRICNVHRNEPGVLGEVNSLVSQIGANISAQHLDTDAQIGYLIMDVEGAHGAQLAQKISQLPRSIKTVLIGS